MTGILKGRRDLPQPVDRSTDSTKITQIRIAGEHLFHIAQIFLLVGKQLLFRICLKKKCSALQCPVENKHMLRLCQLCNSFIHDNNASGILLIIMLHRLYLQKDDAVPGSHDLQIKLIRYRKKLLHGTVPRYQMLEQIHLIPQGIFFHFLLILFTNFLFLLFTQDDFSY